VPQPTARTGAQLLVDQLRIQEVNRVFCVPGESYLAVLDALHDARDIRLITCRQEGGAAMMAEAYGKLTGRPGICMVTRGPGATNASAGLHVAMQDSTPMILFVGQVARTSTEREAFQELDYRRNFAQLAKWTAQIDDPARVPEFVGRAFRIATSGRPGPVVLAVPEDMLNEPTTATDGQRVEPLRTEAGPQRVARLAELLRRAHRPLVLLGGSGWTEAAVEAMQCFAMRNSLPVATTFRRQDRFDNTHPCYAGDVGIGINPKLAQRIRESDLLLVVGARLGEAATSGYRLIDIPVPHQVFIHIHPDEEELGKVYQPSWAIHADVASAAQALADLDLGETCRQRWRPWAEAANADYLAFLEPLPAPGGLHLGRMIRWLSESLPQDAVICNGAGNFATWVHRYYRYRRLGTQLAPISGSMGYGLPAAISAALQHPERTVVCVAGDGDFMMTSQELSTAVQYRLPVVILIVNNGMYGTIRTHQERHYPGRTIATDLVNPDFVLLAHAHGAHAERVERTEDFPAAFERARSSRRPAVLELAVDPEAITIGQSLSEIRKAAMSAQRP